MSLSVVTAGQPFRHHAAFVGHEHLPVHDPLDRAAIETFGKSLAEGCVEVGADDAFRTRPSERVAGTALGDELLLAGDQVGVVLALDRPAATRAQQQATGPGEKTEPAQASGGGERGHRRRNSIRRAGDCTSGRLRHALR